MAPLRLLLRLRVAHDICETSEKVPRLRRGRHAWVLAGPRRARDFLSPSRIPTPFLRSRGRTANLVERVMHHRRGPVTYAAAHDRPQTQACSKRRCASLEWRHGRAGDAAQCVPAFALATASSRAIQGDFVEAVATVLRRSSSALVARRAGSIWRAGSI